MSNIRHVIVIRKDLNFVPGLLAAQAAHTCDGFMRRRILEGGKFTKVELEWMQDPYITVLAVGCKEELEIVQDAAEHAKLKVTRWIDTVISPVLEKKLGGILVGISIGPDDSDKLAVVTGTLPLY